MASSSTYTLSPCERLPDDLLMRVLEHVMRWGVSKEWCGAVRGVSRRWRALHDSACQRLVVRDGLTDEGMFMLFGRLPALTFLDLDHCLVDDAVLVELRGLTELTTLGLNSCYEVTDLGLQYLTSLTALTDLFLLGTSTTKAGRKVLKAALPALTIH